VLSTYFNTGRRAHTVRCESFSTLPGRAYCQSRNITVRELISEIAGASGTAKQKIILAETGRAHF
jgi:hypothetical protein